MYFYLITQSRIRIPTQIDRISQNVTIIEKSQNVTMIEISPHFKVNVRLLGDKKVITLEDKKVGML